jgi:hypothetical protein
LYNNKERERGVVLLFFEREKNDQLEKKKAGMFITLVPGAPF